MKKGEENTMETNTKTNFINSSSNAIAKQLVKREKKLFNFHNLRKNMKKSKYLEANADGADL